jgi:hypothetical protein
MITEVFTNLIQRNGRDLTVSQLIRVCCRVHKNSISCVQSQFCPSFAFNQSAVSSELGRLRIALEGQEVGVT